MKEKTFVIINDKITYIDRYYYESDEMFYFRLKYIIDNYNKIDLDKIDLDKIDLDKIDLDKIDLDKIIGLSKLEQQKKFNECAYDLSSRI
jgi:hypothetical protein